MTTTQMSTAIIRLKNWLVSAFDWLVSIFKRKPKATKRNENQSTQSIYKSLAIPLAGFKYSPRPFSDHEINVPSNARFKDWILRIFKRKAKTDENYLFVGRARIIKTLVDLLSQTRNKRGSYLISGYRGSGKTSTINRAFDEYVEIVTKKFCRTKGRATPIKVTINLGDRSYVKPENIYFSIANNLIDELKSMPCMNIYATFHRVVIILIVTLATLPLIIKGYKSINPIPPDFLSGMFEYTYLVFSTSIYIGIIIYLIWIPLKIVTNTTTAKDIVNRLNNLLSRMNNEVGKSKGINLEFFNFSETSRSLPVESREAEEILIKIIRDIRDKIKRDVVFVLDEIDKLSNTSGFDDKHQPNIDVYDHTQDTKIERINSLLSSIKYFITVAPARFFFIAGRETLDSYYAEKGSTNSLYESLFDRVFEIPSLLTDLGSGYPRTTQIGGIIEEYVCTRVFSPDPHQNNNKKTYSLKSCLARVFSPDSRQNNNKKIYSLKSCLARANPNRDEKLVNITLRNFINYLVFHSWGNPKRLTSIFESFVVPKQYIDDVKEHVYELSAGNDPEQCEHYLLININHRRSFALASEITTLFQHQLSRELLKTGDKLTVSALSSLQFILKLHPYGFTRESLHRMSEAINIHRSPELNTIVDDLLSQIFKAHIRRVRNGSYRYRFNSSFEQELRYISHVSELESASYNFSLDAMSQVKAFFAETIKTPEYNTHNAGAKSHTTLGDMNALEQSYNAASVHYSTAARILTGKIQQELRSNNGVVDLETFMLYIETMVKYGDLEERRQNYNNAAATYSQAEHMIRECGEALRNYIKCDDSKWDMVRQPFWANKFLSLKRSAPYSIDYDSLEQLYIVRDSDDWDNQNPIYYCDDHRFYFKKATLSYFLNQTKNAIRSYLSAIKHARGLCADDFKPDERQAYIEGHSLVSIVEMLLIQESRNFLKHEGQSISFNQALVNFIFNSTQSDKHSGVASALKEINKNINTHRITVLLTKAAEMFSNNRLYISAAVTYIKLISYFAMMLDYFDSNTALLDATLIDNIKDIVSESGINALKCINTARQLGSSQSIKTHLLNDTDSRRDNNISQLFEMLLTDNHSASYPADEETFWQHSIWAQKLSSTLYWAYFSISKIENKPFDLPFPDNFSTFSVRSGIMLRWIYARNLSRKYILHTLFQYDNKEIDCFDKRLFIKNFFAGLNLTDTGSSMFRTYNLKEIEDDNIWMRVYEITRNLYFALQNIRIISRKNLDLISPVMAQIYLVHWRVLCNLSIATIIHTKKYTNFMPVQSLRDITFYIQTKLVKIDAIQAPHERIAPTHFDFEHVHLKILSSLKEAMTLCDITSRSRSNILQQKYYTHDDHNDPEFKLDWTLAHMFSQAAAVNLDKIEEIEKSLRELAHKLS